MTACNAHPLSDIRPLTNQPAATITPSQPEVHGHSATHRRTQPSGARRRTAPKATNSHPDRSGPTLFLLLRSCEEVGPRSGGISLHCFVFPSSCSERKRAQSNSAIQQRGCRPVHPLFLI